MSIRTVTRQAADRPVPARPANPPQKIRLLIIDDDPDYRRMMAGIFGRRGYDVAVAADGVRGLQLALAAPAQVILLDLNMPYRGGLETLRLIRAIDGRVPVVIVAGAWERQAREEAGAFGAMVLPKTTDLGELDQLIRRLAANTKLSGNAAA